MNSLPMNCFARFLASLITMAALLGLTQGDVKAATRPNVVLIMTDDQGYGDIAALGNPWLRTPNIDRLYGESVRFTNFHVDPTCAPTRSALMTGRYSTRTGCWHTIMGRSLIFHDEVLMPKFFKEAGYATGIFGKWHLGDNYPMRPHDLGFDMAVVNGGGGVGQTPDWWGNDYFDDTYWRNGKPEKFKGYCTDVFFDEAEKFITAHQNEPFFVYLPTNVAHSPYKVAEKYTQRLLDLGVPRTPAQFFGMIENFDERLGEFRNFLQGKGLEENTIFIFLTDNGTGEGIPWGDLDKAEWKGFNAGMRGKKSSQYDGGHRVPFFIRWPAGKIGGGRDVKPIAAHIDVLPTLIDLCGLKMTPPNPLDGTSLVPLLRGNANDWPERTLFASIQREEIPPKWVGSAVMTDRWRLIDGSELYDMEVDPGQQNDVAANFPDEVKQLRAKYETWWTSVEPSFSKYGYITIGADAANPVRLTAHDWHSAEPIPWDQGHIKRDMWVNGYWMIEVAKAGRYEFTLYRQPKQANHPLEASKARVRVNDAEAETTVAEDATSATMTLDLKPGTAKLQTWLINKPKNKTRGAFFVHVRRVD